MFNLDEAIARWRRELTAAGVKSHGVLDELESHLREEIDGQVAAGSNPREAFDFAVGRMGDANALRIEFAKSSPEPRRAFRRTFIKILCFTTAAAVFMINAWTLFQFDLSPLEHFAGLSFGALVAFYLISLPYLRRLLSRVASGRFMGALKIASILVFLAPILMFLAVTHVIHLEIGIVTNMAVWSLCVAFFFTPFAISFGDCPGLRGGSSDSDDPLSPVFPGIRPPPSPIWPGLSILPPSNAFTPIARESLAIAREEACRLGHDFVGTEHVLLAVLKLAQGSIANVLQHSNLNCDSVRVEIERLVQAQPGHTSAAALPLTPRACKALRLARSEAKGSKGSLINPEHILLGLLMEGSGVAALALKNLGVGLERIRENISS